MNRLLDLLSADDYDRLRPHLTKSRFEYKQLLYEAGRPIEQVYFPIDGVASLVLVMKDGFGVEVGTIGSEGMVGLPVILGDTSAPSTVYVQVPGRALKMDAKVFSAELARSPTLKIVALHYVHAFFNQVAQSVACAHHHKIEQRCCRWLLMTRDRVPSDEFLLTQEFLGMMLGVQRPSVSLVMNDLHATGTIRYSRGRVKILNRQALHKQVCECYEVSKLEFDRLLADKTIFAAAAGSALPAARTLGGMIQFTPSRASRFCNFLPNLAVPLDVPFHSRAGLRALEIAKIRERVCVISSGDFKSSRRSLRGADVL
jgi:CRP-like cAMP-binding protein